MAKVLTDSKYYKAIADAIRAKNGSTTIYKPSGMAAAISAIQAEDAQPISNFMPESYAVLYQKDAGYIVRVVSPSLSGGEETGTAVLEGTTSMLCNVTDNAFNAINGLKLFVIDGGKVLEIPILRQKGTPVSADVSGGEPVVILAASRKEAMAIMASLGFKLA